ncbi:MAG: hypothetical protein CMF43_03485 [Legionellales bacterium]|nr:hypothetical protein [Legionellales bacterium]
MGRQRSAKRPTHFAILFMQQALVLLLIIALSIIALVTTTAGLQICIWIAKPLLPFSVSVETVRGSVLSGMSIQRATVADLITLHNISAKWSYSDALRINVDAQSAELAATNYRGLTQFPKETQAMIDQVTQWNKLQMVIKPTEQSAYLQADYLATSYRFTWLYEQRSLTIVSGESIDALTINYSMTENNGIYLAADGKLLLPSRDVLVFSPSQINYRDGRLSAHVRAQSRIGQSRLRISVSPSEQQHQLDVEFRNRLGHFEIRGPLGDQSDLTFQAEVPTAQVGQNRAERVRVNGSLQALWRDPSVKLLIRAGQLYLGDYAGQGLSLDYERLPGQSSWVDAAIMFSLDQLSINNQFTFEKIALGNIQGSNQRDYIFTAQQDQTPITAQLTTQAHEEKIDIVISELTSNHSPLLSPGAQKISIYHDRVALTNDSQMGSMGLSGMLYRDGRYAIDIRMQQFLIDSLPRALFAYWNSDIEYLTGKLTANLSLSGVSYTAMPVIYGSFSAKLTESYISALLDGLPMNTGLHIQHADVSGTFRPDLSVQANISTVQGNIILSAQSSDEFRQLTSNIESESLKFFDANGAFVDMQFNINPVIQSHIIDITGKVKINSADYRLAVYTPALGLPAETLIQTGSERLEQLPYRFKIDCDMGQKTLIHVFGFHGLLTGNLTISGSDRTPVSANGELQLNDGSLVIYRQTLPVKKLALSWLDTPIQSPEINLLIMARGLRNIDGRDQMQEYGVRVYGPIEKLVFDYRSTPAPMNSFQIITALLTDASFTKRSNKESIDSMLNAYASEKTSGQVRELLDILSALKSNPFLDNVDISEINFDENNNYVPEVSGVTLSKRLDKTFALRYRVTPYDSRFNRLSIDTYLNDRLILTSFLQNEGDVGIALNYFRTEQ